jgi:hypothetical protein
MVGEDRGMRIEHLKMSKPYPVVRIVKDGTDIVISIGKWYWRFSR